jgi:ABC-type uncharacterized transport system involved in gliding motility auxiliary subunit
MQKFYKYARLIAGLGLLALLIGLVVLILAKELKYAAWSIMVLGVFLLAIAFVLDFRRVSSAVTGRRGRFSTGSTVMVFVFIGITLMVNTISIGNYHEFDTTALSQFTLTSKTKDVLAQLNMPVKAICFFTPSNPYQTDTYATYLLEEYQKYTDKLTIETVDPDAKPETARQYNIDTYSTIVFESENNRRMVYPDEILQQAEFAFTSAILEVTGTVQKKIYFLTGHNEPSIDGDYMYVCNGLRDNLYKVESLDLMVAGAIPQDCTALIIAAPQTPLNSFEFDIIKNYLENDGWVMILTNPGSSPDIKELVSEWWVNIEDGTIIDPSAYISPNKDTPIVPRTQNYFGSYLSDTYFPGAAAITPQKDYPDDVYLLPIVYTSSASWIEKNFDPEEEPEFNEGTDVKGPLAIGVFITIIPPEETEGQTTQNENIPGETTKEETNAEVMEPRLIVFGDSDFASNAHCYNGDNGNLFLNSIELLTTGKELISIEHKVLSYRSMVIGPEETSFIQISSIGLLPLLVLIGGGIIWWRRR